MRLLKATLLFQFILASIILLSVNTVWAQSFTAPYTTTMQIKALRLTGSPSSTEGVLQVYDAPYTATSYLSWPSQLPMYGTDVTQAMLLDLLSAMVMGKQTELNGTEWCFYYMQWGGCTRTLESVTY